MSAREPLDAALLEALGKLATAAPASSMDRSQRIDRKRALEVFESMAASRHLDFAARWLKSQDLGFYTIGSAGHEGNAAVAAATRPTDPALLHYRSGGFFMERARQARPERDPVEMVLLGIVAGALEPIAGGRHKVFGSKALEIIPQTSTIASHLPRAVGLAFALERRKKLARSGDWSPARYPDDALVVCSFGDASANHSTLTGAINTACHCAHQKLPLPLLFVCEDNGWGISVETPPGWIASAYGSRPHLEYVPADGGDLLLALAAAQRAVSIVRAERRPVFLHLSTVRFMGHAGSDAENAYRSAESIKADFARDPLLRSAERLVGERIATVAELLTVYESTRERVMGAARAVAHAPKLESATQVMAPLAPRRPDAVATEAARAPDPDRRLLAHEGKLPEDSGPATLSIAINRALTDILVKDRETLVFGEDVARKGGVYGVTKGLFRRFGAGRVFDTVLDEQSILGLGLGSALAGFLPIPEIQYLAYLHNAEDQLRGEAATLSFFSNGAYKNPMVIRIAGYGYQKGFGGHFHNDDAVAVLRDIPGLIVASPARADDAAAMLRSCAAAARVDGSVCVFLEPIALYHTKDWFEDGDGAFLAGYDAPADWSKRHVPIGSARVYGTGTDLTIVTFANGVYMSRRVARTLEHRGIHARVVDLRWLAPLPVEQVLQQASISGRVLVVDETRKSGGVSEGILAGLIDGGFQGRMARVTSEDSFIPLGAAANHVLLSEATILQSALRLAER